MGSYGEIGQRTAGYAAREMLRHAEPLLSLSQFAKPVVLLSSLPWWKRALIWLKLMRPPLISLKLPTIAEGSTVKFRRPQRFRLDPLAPIIHEIEKITNDRTC